VQRTFKFLKKTFQAHLYLVRWHCVQQMLPGLTMLKRSSAAVVVFLWFSVTFALRCITWKREVQCCPVDVLAGGTWKLVVVLDLLVGRLQAMYIHVCKQCRKQCGRLPLTFCTSTVTTFWLQRPYFGRRHTTLVSDVRGSLLSCLHVLETNRRCCDLSVAGLNVPPFAPRLRIGPRHVQ